MSKKILVTGGAGFIGSHLVDRLVSEGNEVVVFDSLDEQVHGKPAKVPAYFNPKAKLVKGDVRDRNALKAALEGAEAVYHEAAVVGVGQSMYEVERYVDANARGTATLMDVLVNGEHDVKKLVVAASMSSYGEGAYSCEACGTVYPPLRSEAQLAAGKWEPDCPKCGGPISPIPTDEGKPLQTNSIYGFSKESQEKIVMMLARTYGIPAVSLRYFNVYGPRQSLDNPYTGVAAIFLNRIKNKARPYVFEDGLQSRDFISVHDIVEANILALKSGAADYEIFNVGTGIPITIRKVAEDLAGLCGSKIAPEISAKYRSGDVRHCFADISKIRGKLGFLPKDSSKGFAEVVRWSEKQGAADNFGKARSEMLSHGLVK